MYAILSHRWTTEEVLYEDMRNGTGDQKAGYRKIAKACSIAAASGYSYIWIDTCCIDKSSSAELSEAINSMFAWYQNSGECLAYLEDVDSSVDDPALHNILKSSKWFERGWTLQELIAPGNVGFYSRDWTFIGGKGSLRDTLSQITKIDIYLLVDGSVHLAGISVAKRMSWAAYRKTTRPEDMAYSLLGIFDVNMPLLYGEGGTKAFRRLQEEIMKVSSDQSILAWTPPKGGSPEEILGVLADHPSAFSQAAAIVPFERADGPYNMTNLGLQIILPILTPMTSLISAAIEPSDLKTLRTLSRSNLPMKWAVLSCHEETNIVGPLAIALCETASSKSQVIFRLNLRPFSIMEAGLDREIEYGRAKHEAILLGRNVPLTIDDRYTLFSVRLKIVPGKSWKSSNTETNIEGEPAENWNADTRVMTFRTTSSATLEGRLKIDIGPHINTRGPIPGKTLVPLIFTVKKGRATVYLSESASAENPNSSSVQTITVTDRTKRILRNDGVILAGINQEKLTGKSLFAVHVTFRDEDLSDTNSSGGRPFIIQLS